MDVLNDGVMVALLPIMSDGMQTDFPHLTLVFAGASGDLTPTSLDGLAKAAASFATWCRPITLRVLTKSVFGEGTQDNPKVDVLQFHPNLDLVKMRSLVDDWDVSKFPFRPHMTVGPESSWQGTLPRFVAFDRVAFVNGNDRQEFMMGNSVVDREAVPW